MRGSYIVVQFQGICENEQIKNSNRNFAQSYDEGNMVNYECFKYSMNHIAYIKHPTLVDKIYLK